MSGQLRERELRILSELMKNSKQSDRELAKKLRVSQATVTRTRAKLEKQGFIKEYTIIPDFSKLGYKIMAITFGLSRALPDEAVEKARNVIHDAIKDEPFGFVMLERGVGLGFDGVIITYHRNYASYQKFLRWLGLVFPKDLVDVERIDSFLVNLDDTVRYLPLTFSMLAKDLLPRAQEKGKN
jgi:DNA-binding Lrp family transcriptional regulator